jgi:gas vesicle protein
MTESKRGDMFAATLVAGMIGAGLALLFAPRSGRETREKIRDKSEDLKQQATVSMTNVREALEKDIQEAQDLKRRLTDALHSDKSQLADDSDTSIADMPKRAQQSSVLSTWEEEV